MSDALRLPAEQRHVRELAALAAADTEPRPEGWSLSPRAVTCFVLGSAGAALPVPEAVGGGEVVVSRKFYGHDALVQRAVVTLASDRALLLVGEPGTAKSWLSEHLAAAISGTSLLTIQGSAGITEDQIKYGWNYALLLAEGPTPRALVPAPLYTGMRSGQIVRFEEITRAPHEVQDTLLSALSEKLITVPELSGEDGVVMARPGFNVVATANTRDRGVNDMSAALKRRFNFETVPPLDDLQEEARVVRERVTSLLATTPAHDVRFDDDVLDLLITTFHEVRGGQTTDGIALDRPTAVLSTAEAVSVGVNAGLHAAFFGEGAVTPEHLVQHLPGTAAKEGGDDLKVLRSYFEVAAKGRAKRELGAWKAYYAARRHLD
jgi:MoxR-like ATPase